jgi:hypothetical protein
MRLFTLLVTYAWLCVTSLASPPPQLNVEDNRSHEFFRLAEVSKWLATREPQPSLGRPWDHPLTKLIWFGDINYEQENYDEAVLSYEKFLEDCGNAEQASPLIALIRDKLTAAYSLSGKHDLADAIIKNNGRRVTFGGLSRVLYQKRHEGDCHVLMCMPLDTVAKFINYRTGELEAIVWSVAPQKGWGDEFVFTLPRGVYQIVFAQEVRKKESGEYYALVHRRLLEPLYLRDSLMVRLSHPDFVETTADAFGSFSQLKPFEQHDHTLMRRLQAELVRTNTPDSRKAELKILISSYTKWLEEVDK